MLCIYYMHTYIDNLSESPVKERVPATVPRYFFLLGKQTLLPGHSHISQGLPIVYFSAVFLQGL